MSATDLLRNNDLRQNATDSSGSYGFRLRQVDDRSGSPVGHRPVRTKPNQHAPCRGSRDIAASRFCTQRAMSHAAFEDFGRPKSKRKKVSNDSLLLRMMNCRAYGAAAIHWNGA